MKVLQNERMCTGCGLCAQICPTSCIQLQPGKDGFLYPVKNMDKCIGCEKCVKECPAIHQKTALTPLEGYAFEQTDVSSRIKSASGGAADAFAKAIIRDGGVYTGVRYNDNLQAVHSLCQEEAHLDLFRDSKYVQSDTGNIFSCIRDALEAGKKVLATGTPCQIAAIKAYLKKDYENLILCDLVCHGVPSPLVFQKYLQAEERKTKKRIKGFYFRDKTNGWRKSNVRIVYSDGTEKILRRKDCDYFRLFGNDMIFRDSCHNCQFRNFTSGSDLTIGDFWGIEKKYPDFTDDQGCSAVIVNTPKGKAFFEQLCAEHRTMKTGVDFILETHPKLQISIPKSQYRNLFFRLLKPDGSGYENAVKTVLNGGIFYKIKRMLLKGLLR